MEEIQISSPLVWKELDSENILVGKLLTNKSFTKNAIESILRKAWNLEDGFDVTEISGNAFMFKFAKVGEFDRILRGRPWTINGCLLNLLERSKFKAYEEFDFSQGPIWIQLHNIPMEAMCLENAVTIGGYVGDVVLAENPFYNGRYLRSFLRVRVVLDLRKPLACGFWMPRPDGRKVWISIRYEKLQSFCYNCGRIGHDNKSCKSERVMSMVLPSESRFGAWLTTNSCRNWDEVMTVVKDEWIEANDARKKREEALRRKGTEDRRQGNRASHPPEDEIFCIKVNKSLLESEMDGTSRGHSKGEVENLGAVYGGRASLEIDRGKETGSILLDKGKQTERGQEESLEFLNRKANDSPLNVVAEQKIGLQRSCDLVNESVPAEEVHPLAMVVYSGQILTEMINGIKCIGLKRKAMEDDDKMDQKRRKLAIVETNPDKDIFEYATCLRKTKARIKRNDKRKRKKDKENLVEEGMDYDEDMGDAADSNAPGSEFIFRAKVGSDHHALIVDCWFCEDKVPKHFKFEAAWAQHEDFLRIVGEGWNDVEGHLNNRLIDLIRRLEACQKRLVKWSRSEFPNFKKVIDQLRRRLHTCYEGQMSLAGLKEAEDLVKQLEEAWVREESYWWQRSRITWLNCGDQNSKFFHRCVIQRRQRNKVLRLKDENGIWLEEREEINKAFSDFYQNLFRSGGSRCIDQAISYVREVVTAEENERLMATGSRCYGDVRNYGDVRK
ncbi:hypothetical protein K1719_034925 [Acacia pycnantha]|nr:hypothetical protein K1719_034925 [Acacia pycnantha]